MKLRKAVYGQVMLGVAALVPFLNGCSKSEEVGAPPLALSRIQKLASVCREFAVANRRQPANIEELKNWAKKLPQAQQTNLGIENVDEAFISPRDQQPYVIRGGAQKPGPMMILAHEKTGEGGKRYVVTTTGSVLELEDKAFNEVLANTR